MSISLRLKAFCLFFFYISVLISGDVAQAQNQQADSLKNLLKTSGIDSKYIDILNEISWKYYISNQFDSSVVYSQLAEQKAQEISYINGQVKAIIYIANNYLKLGDYPLSLEYYTQALILSRKDNLIQSQASAIGGMAQLHKRQKQYDKALEKYHECLELFIQMKDTARMAGTYNNIGIVYQEKENYPKALEFLNTGTELFRKTNDYFGLSYSYTNHAGVHIDMKNYRAADLYYDSILLVSAKAGIPTRNTSTFLAKGFSFLKQNKPVESRKWLIKALDMATYEKNLIELKDAYLLISKSDSMLGDYKNAYQNYKNYDRLNDSIFNESNTRKITEMEMKYEFSKQKDSIRVENEKEIAIRDATLTVHKREKWILSAGLLILGSLGILLYRQNVIRKRSNRKLHQLNMELEEADRNKNRFFSILNHDLRSPVSSLIHFLQLKKDASVQLDEESEEKLEQKTMQHAKRLLINMEDLLLWSKGQMVNFKPYPSDISVKDIFNENTLFFSEIDHIQFSYSILPENLSVHTDENYLKTIIRNLTSNSIKALQNIPHPQIIWEAYSEEKCTYIKITDNGPGASPGKFRALYDETEVIGIKSGLGLHLIRDLAQAVNCKIIVDKNTERGVSIALKFDK